MRDGHITEWSIISIIHFLTSSCQLKTMACSSWQVLFITGVWLYFCTTSYLFSVGCSVGQHHWANHWYDWHQFLPFILNKDVPTYHPSCPPCMATWVSMVGNSVEKTISTDFHFRKQEFIYKELREMIQQHISTKKISDLWCVISV